MRKRATRPRPRWMSMRHQDRERQMSRDNNGNKPNLKLSAVNRRNILLGGTTLAAAATIVSGNPIHVAQAQQQAAGSGRKPNILVIFGDDIGQSNISAYTFGLMGYRTPNIDRIAREGMMFTDYYAEQSCTAGRSTFITGQSTLRTGMSKVGIPGATIGLRAEDITIAEALKPLGYATGQFGKNHPCLSGCHPQPLGLVFGHAHGRSPAWR